MTRLRTALVAFVGLAFVAVGITIGIGSQPTGSNGATGGMILLALVAIGVGLRKVRGTLDASANGPTVPWTDDDRFATPAPERTDREPPLSSDGLTRVVDEAGRTAREADTVDDGLAIVRPVLRETLSDALVQGGRPRSAARAAIDDGSWTDDRIAASVLSADVEPPTRPFHDRLRAWLFPERVVRRRTRRAMGAVAEAADEALPTVPGQTAPRNVPVLQPRLEELQRGAGGDLQRAVDPDAIARGPRSSPRRPGNGGAGRRGPRNEADGDGEEVADG